MGRFSQRIRQDDVVTTYTYDDLHHLTGRSYSSSDPNETFQFDRSGRLVSATRAGVAHVAYAYDHLGRVLSEVQQFLGADSDTFTTTYHYAIDSSGGQRDVTYPSARVVSEAYDSRWRMTGIDGDALGSQAVGIAYGYDAINRRTSATSAATGVSSVFGYDINNRITGITHSNGGGDIYDVAFGYDPVGNRLYTEDSIATNRSELYEYDRLNRLRGFERGVIDTSGTPEITTQLASDDLPGAQSWTLDHEGNWTGFSQTLGATPATKTQTRTPDAVNEYTGITIGSTPYSPAYDDKGNLTQDPTAHNLGDDPNAPTGQTYTYDAENRLVAVRRQSDNALLLTIEYGPLGRRIESTDTSAAADPNAACGGGQNGAGGTTTRHIYAGIETIEEHVRCLDGGGSTWTLAREFIWGPGFPEPVAMVDHTDLGDVAAGTPEILHYLTGALGSVRMLVNAAGEPVERYTYDPYGKTLIEQTDPNTGLPTGRLATSAYGNPFAWTGHRYDVGVELYHFLCRSYSPVLGRWLQRDPIGYADGVNLLAYASGSPLVFIDPLGLFADVPGWVKMTDCLFPKSYAAEKKYVDNVCIACEVAQLPADIATAGIGTIVKEGVKKLAKKVVKEGVEMALEEGAEAAVKKALKEGAEEVVEEVIEEGVEKAAKKAAEEAIEEGAEKAAKEAAEEAAEKAGKTASRTGGGKNARHGKAGVKPSQEQQVKDLQEQLGKATTRKEKVQIKNKIDNIKKDMAKRRKGEEHSRKAKGQPNK